VGFRARQGGEHEVADAQQGEPRSGGTRGVGTEDEEEDLEDVVVALEVAEGWVESEDGGDEVGEFVFAGEHAGFGFVWRWRSVLGMGVRY
jgi:hypothetical protein